VDFVAEAERVARERHKDQFDKAGAPYILHPERVAIRLHDAGWGPEVVAAGWLHDVIEDSELTEDELRGLGFTDRTVGAVSACTRYKKVPGWVYYRLIRCNPIARAVKLADIADNMEPWRMIELEASTRERLIAKYTKAREELGW